MEDIEPPSFSLGFDFDFHPEPPSRIDPNPNPNPNPNTDPNKPDSQWCVSDSDLDSPQNPPPSRLRRLRRIGSPVSSPINKPVPLINGSNSFEDDIEDFSEEDYRLLPTDPFRSLPHQASCSSSKLPLSGSGVLIRPRESTIRNTLKKQDSDCPPSTSVASNKGKSVYQDFTPSPLRRFQLLDSDSDDPSESAHVKGTADGVDLSKTGIQKELNFGSGRKISCLEKTKLSASTSQNQDLWKSFRVDNNGSVPTPVFDEFLEEYYQDGRQNKAVSGSHEFGSSGIVSNLNDASNFMETRSTQSTALPCHRYFFHDDNRIQRLVRGRLSFFCPISMSGDTGNMPYNASSIDYRSQFGNGDSAAANKRTSRKDTVKKSTTRAPKRNKKANIVEGSQATGTWVDPKQTDNTPKDAGKRRVSADGQSPGHWSTGNNGKKVYVTKSGKELFGRLAYRQYKKDNGGFQKPAKKKRASKKK